MFKEQVETLGDCEEKESQGASLAIPEDLQGRCVVCRYRWLF